MPLYDFRCKACKTRFETLVSTTSPEPVVCPKCKSQEVDKQVSRFFVAGRGDLRESTLHGCHDHYTGVEQDHSHADHDHGDHGHDHGDGE